MSRHIIQNVIPFIKFEKSLLHGILAAAHKKYFQIRRITK